MKDDLYSPGLRFTLKKQNYPLFPDLQYHHDIQSHWQIDLVRKNRTTQFTRPAEISITDYIYPKCCITLQSRLFNTTVCPTGHTFGLWLPAFPEAQDTITTATAEMAIGIWKLKLRFIDFLFLTTVLDILEPV